jgi:predicted RNA-binding Zn-ribbon protein involved in translation (DUF1610 family)
MAKRTVSQAPHWCPDCETIVHLAPVYECGNCGQDSLERRCEDCRKFCARREEDGCETCMAECEPVEVVTDHDGELIRAEDYVADGPSLAVRNAAAEAAYKAERAATAKKETEKAYAGAVAKPWSEVKVGDEILSFTRDGSLDTILGNTAVLSVQTVGPHPLDPSFTPGQVIVHTARHSSIALQVHNPDEIVHVSAKPEARDAEPAPSDRYTVGTVDHASGGNLKYISADMTIDSMRDSGAIVGVIVGKNTLNSGSTTGVATFADPVEAESFAVAARVAADLLAEVSTEDADVPLSLGESEHVFTSGTTRYVSFRRGIDDFMEKQIMQVRTGSSPRGSMGFSIENPAVLRNIAEAADWVALQLRTALDIQA